MFGSCSFSSLRARVGLWIVSMTAASWSSSCSLMLSTDQKQCTADADCSARGLPGSVCIEHLCQPLLTSPSVAGRASAPDAATTPNPPPAEVSPAAPAPSAEAAGVTASADAGASGGAAGASASAADAAGSLQPSAAGAAGKPAPASAGAGGAAACSGSGCPECTVDADCERSGV